MFFNLVSSLSLTLDISQLILLSLSDEMLIGSGLEDVEKISFVVVIEQT